MRVPLTADTECPHCKGKGVVEQEEYIGGPTRRYVCECVKASPELEERITRIEAFLVL